MRTKKCRVCGAKLVLDLADPDAKPECPEGHDQDAPIPTGG